MANGRIWTCLIGLLILTTLLGVSLSFLLFGTADKVTFDLRVDSPIVAVTDFRITTCGDSELEEMCETLELLLEKMWAKVIPELIRESITEITVTSEQLQSIEDYDIYAITMQWSLDEGEIAFYEAIDGDKGHAHVQTFSSCLSQVENWRDNGTGFRVTDCVFIVSFLHREVTSAYFLVSAAERCWDDDQLPQQLRMESWLEDGDRVRIEGIGDIAFDVSYPRRSSGIRLSQLPVCLNYTADLLGQHISRLVSKELEEEFRRCKLNYVDNLYLEILRTCGSGRKFDEPCWEKHRFYMTYGDDASRSRFFTVPSSGGWYYPGL